MARIKPKNLLLVLAIFGLLLAGLAQDIYRSSASINRSTRHLVDLGLVVDTYAADPATAMKGGNRISLNSDLSALEAESLAFAQARHIWPYAIQKQHKLDQCTRAANETARAIQVDQLFRSISEKLNLSLEQMRARSTDWTEADYANSAIAQLGAVHSDLLAGDYNHADILLGFMEADLDKLEADQKVAIAEFKLAANQWGEKLHGDVSTNRSKLQACVDEVTF